MSTADEREDEIERLHCDGRVHRWARRSAAWPGHTTFVALRGGDVVMGDRYAAEGIERTYACDLASLLEGCFQDVVAAQLGTRVLNELLGEARRELGVAAASVTMGPQAAPNPGAPGAPSSAKSTRAEEAKPAPAPAPPAPPTPAPPKAEEARPAPAPAPPLPKAEVAKPAPAPATPPKPAAAGKGRVDVAVVACRQIALPLLVTLRAITRSPVKDLLARLQALPCRVATGLTREQAEGVAARLSGLGAEIQLLPDAT